MPQWPPCTTSSNNFLTSNVSFAVFTTNVALLQSSLMPSVISPSIHYYYYKWFIIIIYHFVCFVLVYLCFVVRVATALPSLKNLHSPLLKNLISSFPPIDKTAEYFLDSVSEVLLFKKRCLFDYLKISPQAATDGNLQELFVDATQFPEIAEGKKVSFFLLSFLLFLNQSYCLC